MENDLSKYKDLFLRLRVNVQHGHVSPHKPSMLLAVIGMAEAGILKENKVRYEPPLLERYAEIFGCVKTESDHPNPYFPFYHLQSDGFWHLRARPGAEKELKGLRSARSHGQIIRFVDFAYLDSPLFRLLLQPESRGDLEGALVEHWFPESREQLARASDENQYELLLRDKLSGSVREPRTVAYERIVRSTAFRRIVTEIYDFRCAASGRRVLLPSGHSLVQAAHLIPHADTQDDDPRNGLALTPDFHWAMDQRVIAPGPGYKWHVSKELDWDNPDNAYLFELDGKQLNLPKDNRLWPRCDALEVRLKMLL